MWLNLEANSNYKRRNCSQHCLLFEGLKEYCASKNFNHNFRRASTPSGNSFGGSYNYHHDYRDHQNNNYFRGKGNRSQAWDSDYRPRYQKFQAYRSNRIARESNFTNSNSSNSQDLHFRPGYLEFLNARRPNSSLGYYDDELMENDFGFEYGRGDNLGFERINSFRNRGRKNERNNNSSGRWRRSQSVANLYSPAANNRKSSERELKKLPSIIKSGPSAEGNLNRLKRSYSITNLASQTVNNKISEKGLDKFPSKSKSPGTKTAKIVNSPAESSKVGDINLIRRTIHQCDDTKGELSKIQKITFSSDSELEDDLQKSTPPKKAKINSKEDKTFAENKTIPDIFTWGNSEDEDFENWKEENKKDGKKYLFNANNLPKYDGTTPFGTEGGVALQVHACIFCGVVYKSEALLQQHFLMRSHYNKYKSILNEVEVIQTIKKC